MVENYEIGVYAENDETDALHYLSFYRRGKIAFKYNWAMNNEKISMDFNDEQFAAIGDFINIFYDEDGNLDTDRLKEVAEFIRDHY